MYLGAMSLVDVLQITIAMLSMDNDQAFPTQRLIASLAKIFQNLAVVCRAVERSVGEQFLLRLLSLKFVETYHFVFFCEPRSSMSSDAMRTEEFHALDASGSCGILLFAIGAVKRSGVTHGH